ncbi:hypothetical protein Tco_0629374 [Tanacetum coccineum]|uniref:Reverse transcriptase domain-containing protein n=1 Tax=Tanacetum coccineum TaxID=301880 RepID=A0ABQ4WSV7_9ASTR
MADNRTMAQMLQAPIEGYEDAIVIPPINANNFELKETVNQSCASNKCYGRQDPHNHLRFFNKVTSTFRHPEVPNTSVKLLLFPFSLDGEARDWLDKEPPRSILTWDDLERRLRAITTACGVSYDGPPDSIAGGEKQRKLRYSQEVLGFSDSIAYTTILSVYDPIRFTSSSDTLLLMKAGLFTLKKPMLL